MSEPVASATTVLMEALERFGECEPRCVMVLWTDEKRDIIVMSNFQRVEAVGILEIAKGMCMNQVGQ